MLLAKLVDVTANLVEKILKADGVVVAFHDEGRNRSKKRLAARQTLVVDVPEPSRTVTMADFVNSSEDSQAPEKGACSRESKFGPLSGDAARISTHFTFPFAVQIRPASVGHPSL